MPWPAAGCAPPARPRREQLFARNRVLNMSTVTLPRPNCFGCGSGWTPLVVLLVFSSSDCMVPSGRTYSKTVRGYGESPSCLFTRCAVLSDIAMVLQTFRTQSALRFLGPWILV